MLKIEDCIIATHVKNIHTYFFMDSKIVSASIDKILIDVGKKLGGIRTAPTSTSNTQTKQYILNQIKNLSNE